MRNLYDIVIYEALAQLVPSDELNNVWCGIVRPECVYISTSRLVVLDGNEPL